MARYCNKCNALIEDGGSFCTECGGSDIREDDTIIEDNSIPEIKPISNSLANTIDTSAPGTAVPIPSGFIPTEDKAPTLTSKEEESKSNNSFADVPDFMNGDSNTNNSQDIKVPSDFHLVDGGTENDYSQPVNNINQMNTTTKSNGKSKNKYFSTIIGIVVFVVVAGLLFYFYYSKNNAVVNTTGEPFISTDLTKKTAEDTKKYADYYNSTNSKRVGMGGYGYISIPNDWIKYSDMNGSKTMMYTDNGTWIVTIYGVPTNTQNAVDWANSVYHAIEDNGGQNITTGKTIINDYPALKISAYYPNYKKYITAWVLEVKDGTTHYLAIEGPESTSDYYNIIYSFRSNN